MTRKRRYCVRLCDNCGSLPEAPRDRTWLVWDRQEDKEVADLSTRAAASAYRDREEAIHLGKIFHKLIGQGKAGAAALITYQIRDLVGTVFPDDVRKAMENGTK